MLNKFSILFFISPVLVFGNNLRIDNSIILPENSSDHTRLIQFNISWDNSWKDSLNWDAAWVFIKYKVGNGVWQHATLSTSMTDHSAPAGSTINPRADGKGVFIYRSNNGTGTINLTKVQLRWLYGNDGVPDGSLIQIKVIGIEMVYIPQGNFYAGDGEEVNYEHNFGAFRSGSIDKTPWYIGSENALRVTNISSGGYYYVRTWWNNIIEDTTGSTFTIPAAFPKGYNPIYCMKYEITQGQYTDFLNKLTRTQQKSRVATDISSDAITKIYVMGDTSIIYYRNVINCPSSGNGITDPIVFSCDKPDRACNLINWADGCAYSDWSGQRPMTELEYEKICRGPIYPVVNEYAWGTTNATSASIISGIEDGTETITNTGVNCCCLNEMNTFQGGDSGFGPLRVGIFAGENTTREQRGASYYGVMEMSGNLWERCVSVGNTTGRSFTGTNGDGVLDNTGAANVPSWAGTNALGTGLRGGSWRGGWRNLRVSDRNHAADQNADRWRNFGFRSVSAP